MSVDPLVGTTEQVYNYAGGSPTNYRDPTGQCPFCEMLIELVQKLLEGGGEQTVEHTVEADVESVATVSEVAANEVEVVGAGEACSTELANPYMPEKGRILYRVWGGNALPNGRSYTPIDPRTLADYRNVAGLPDVNTGKFLRIVRITDPSVWETRPAKPLDGNIGGLIEYVLRATSQRDGYERVGAEWLIPPK